MKNILFVCTGNTCRSPMAEAILKSYQIEGISVKSAGVYAFPGDAASVNAKLVLEDNQISHDHSASPFSEKEVEWADYIFTMTEGHKQLIASRYPQAIERTFTLKEFVLGDSYDRDVSDPYGGSKQMYERTFIELKQLISGLVEKIND